MAVDSWLKTLGKFADLWKIHLEKRRELYELSLQKKRNKALNAAEDVIAASRRIIDYVNINWPMSDDERKEVQKLINRFNDLVKRFNKYD